MQLGNVRGSRSSRIALLGLRRQGTRSKDNHESTDEGQTIQQNSSVAVWGRFSLRYVVTVRGGGAWRCG